jgi:serine/threonine protein kinase
VGRYELVRPIGSGATAIVYEARDGTVDRSVALKVRHLLPDGEHTRRAQTRFLREARAAAQVHHPNVVTLFDFGVDAGLAFLAMELVHGETLAQLLRRQGALSVRKTVGLLVPMLSAVAELHANGVVHRDIKPANILVTRGDSLAKLADFGVSRLVDELSSATESGAMLGTLDYMAPEVMLDARAASELSDQYSLGVVLYECLTGGRPFRGLVAYELMRATIHERPTPPSQVAPHLGSAVDAIILRAMHREPDQRFASMDDLADALRSLAVTSDPAPRSTTFSGVRRVVPRCPDIAVREGVAIATAGDAFVAVWRSAALIDLIKWQFDLADRFVATKPDGIVALIILQPSSAPPDAQTALECIRRLRALAPKTRRQATVALGGGLWLVMVQDVHRIMASYMPARQWRMTLSSSIHDGIASLLEKGGPDTPSHEDLFERVVALHEALELEPPAALAASAARH